MMVVPDQYGNLPTVKPYDMVLELFLRLGSSRQKVVAFSALVLLLENEDADGVKVVLGYINRGASECNSQVKQTYNFVIKRAATFLPLQRPLDVKPLEGLSERGKGAAEAVLDKCLDFIDDRKEKAFVSTFLEPDRMLLHQGGVGVDVHEGNQYLAALMVGIFGAIQIPLALGWLQGARWC